MWHHVVSLSFVTYPQPEREREPEPFFVVAMEILFVSFQFDNMLISINHCGIHLVLMLLIFNNFTRSVVNWWICTQNLNYAHFMCDSKWCIMCIMVPMLLYFYHCSIGLRSYHKHCCNLFGSIVAEYKKMGVTRIS